MPEVDVTLAAGHHQHHWPLAEMQQIVSGLLHWYRYEKLDGIAVAVERQLGVRHAAARYEIGGGETYEIGYNRYKMQLKQQNTVRRNLYRVKPTHPYCQPPSHRSAAPR